MRSKLIAIGNSRGVRLPKEFIDLAGLEGDVELEASANGVTIRPVSSNRKDWEERFRKAGKDMTAADWGMESWANLPGGFDQSEWEW